MYQELKVDPSEILFRVFFRDEGQPLALANQIDFERREKIKGGRHAGKQEGGISFSRSHLMSIQKLIFNTRNREPGFKRGLLLFQASEILELGYKFFGEQTSPGHVCMHCPGCSFEEYSCKSTNSACPLASFDLRGDAEQREDLASASSVLIEASDPTELLTIFGTDINETDVGIAAANSTYMSRWREARTAHFGRL